MERQLDLCDRVLREKDQLTRKLKESRMPLVDQNGTVIGGALAEVVI